MFLRVCLLMLATRPAVDASQQQAFITSQDATMMLRLVHAQVLRALGRRAEALAALESVAAQGSEALLLYSLQACVVRRRQPRRCYASRAPPRPPTTWQSLVVRRRRRRPCASDVLLAGHT